MRPLPMTLMPMNSVCLHAGFGESLSPECRRFGVKTSVYAADYPFASVTIDRRQLDLKRVKKKKTAINKNTTFFVLYTFHGQHTIIITK